MDRNTEMVAQRQVKRAKVWPLVPALSGPRPAPLGWRCNLAKPSQEFSQLGRRLQREGRTRLAGGLRLGPVILAWGWQQTSKDAN